MRREPGRGGTLSLEGTVGSDGGLQVEMKREESECEERDRQKRVFLVWARG